MADGAGILARLFGPRLTVNVTVTGLVQMCFVRFQGEIRLRGRPRVRDLLRSASRAAGADLLAALAEGHQPVLLLNGSRIELPEGLELPVADGDELAWLLPMAGG